jgi:putative pyruvate formate lyase activating enzyme
VDPVAEPRYLKLAKSGELKKRAEQLAGRLSSCDICPRDCHVNRVAGERGYCHSGYLPIVASFCDHHGEEPAISGARGSGTIFFGNCNLSCVYCQNHQISQDWKEQSRNEVEISELARDMIYLQDRGCHNINFVSPSHFVPQVVKAVEEAAGMELHIPLVYNSSGYDSPETVTALDGIIDIYLPDIRYSSDSAAARYSGAKDYVINSRQAIKEMYRQVGDLLTDEEGIAISGLIVRHLILPNGLAGTAESFEWLVKELSPSVTLSVMAQYSPQFKAGQFPEIARKISRDEYESAIAVLERLGLENGWLQEMEASDNYLPDFSTGEHPFESRSN